MTLSSRSRPAKNKLLREHQISGTALFLVVVAVVIAGTLALMIWNPFERRRKQDGFSDIARDFLIRLEDGAICRFDFRDSGFWFSFERTKGADGAAGLELRIPRVELTDGKTDDLRQAFRSHGFEFSETEPDNISLLAKVPVPVGDIWNKASGARPAHAARILVETVGLPRSERFKVAELGNPNKDVLSRVDDL